MQSAPQKVSVLPTERVAVRLRFGISGQLHFTFEVYLAARVAPSHR